MREQVRATRRIQDQVRAARRIQEQLSQRLEQDRRRLASAFPASAPSTSRSRSRGRDEEFSSGMYSPSVPELVRSETSPSMRPGPPPPSPTSPDPLHPDPEG